MHSRGQTSPRPRFARTPTSRRPGRAIDRSTTTTETSTHRRCRISDQLLKVGLPESEWLSQLKPHGGLRKPNSTADRRCKAKARQVEAAEWLHLKCITVADKSYRDAWRAFRHWKDNDDGSDDSGDGGLDYDRGVGGLRGHAY